MIREIRRTEGIKGNGRKGNDKGREIRKIQKGREMKEEGRERGIQIHNGTIGRREEGN